MTPPLEIIRSHKLVVGLSYDYASQVGNFLPTYATCPTHPIILHFINLLISEISGYHGGEYED
jgi:hypothetical protein